jgi:hypothetical protein
MQDILQHLQGISLRQHENSEYFDQRIDAERQYYNTIFDAIDGRLDSLSTEIDSLRSEVQMQGAQIDSFGTQMAEYGSRFDQWEQTWTDWFMDSDPSAGPSQGPPHQGL